MGGVVEGFFVVGAVVLCGYIIGRTGALGSRGQEVLSRLSFVVGLPTLMFATIARSEPGEVFSATALVSFLSAISVMLLFAVVAVIRRRRSAEVVVGAMSSGYVNSSNLGIPLSVYVLGSAVFVTPIMLYQLALVTPIALTILDLSQGRNSGASAARRLAMPLRNPVTMAAVAGVVVATTGWHIPAIVLEPIVLVSQMTVPMMLLAFGLSLPDMRTDPVPRGMRLDVVLASVLKLLVQPALALVLALWVFDLPSGMIFAVVTCALLPTGQNVYIYATRYGVGVPVARAVVLVTTIASVPLLLLAAGILA